MRVAVLGIGSIGMRHLDVLSQIDPDVPIAVSRRPHQLKMLQDLGYLTANTLSDAALLGADFCIVATETGRHVTDGLNALAAGFHVLVEKPMAINADTAVFLKEKADEKGRSLFVACVCRFSKSLNLFRDHLATIGEIHSIRIECQSYLPKWQPGRDYLNSFRASNYDGGVLLDLTHEIDYAGWLFGWPNAIQANIRNLGILGIDSCESAELFWEMESGCSVSVKLDYLTHPDRRRMLACGVNGSMEWDGIEGQITLNIKGTSKIIKTSQGRDDLLASQSKAFIESTSGFPDPRLAPATDGVRVLSICDAAIAASEKRAEVLVDYK